MSLGYNGNSGNFDVTFEFHNNLPPPPHKGHFPQYYKHGEEAVLQAKIEDLEKQNIVAKESVIKESNINFQVKYASPCMLARKASSKHMPEEEYNILSVAEKAKRHRFVLCPNKLSNCINKKPALTTNIQDTISIVGSNEYVITADLMDSFNQSVVYNCLYYFRVESSFHILNKHRFDMAQSAG